MPYEENITGFVLAGGKSSRFGTEKGLFAWRGLPLVTYSLSLLEDFCSRVYINTLNHDYEAFGKQIVADEHTDMGPLAGIAACLKFSQTPWNFFLPCDMPLIPAGLIQHILTFRRGNEAVIPLDFNQLPEPLIGVYHKRALSTAEEKLKQGHPRMTDFLATIKTAYIPTPKAFIQSNPHAFANMNSGIDLIP
jgi:molybdopterin-guanine dinucleotide biosynthesis protein A